MSGRRANANANRIRGPQSALTDFLASHNISARAIRDSARQRQQDAEEQNAQANPSEDTTTVEAATSATSEEQETEVAESSRAGGRKRKRGPDEAAQAKAAASVAAEKAAAKKNKSKKKSKKAQDDDDSDFDLGKEMYKKSKPLPGQLENCELCNKRFTVTAYSQTGPAGGLLCTPCGKKQKDDDKKLNKFPKKTTTGKKRRLAESNRLDGMVQFGSKSLQQLCIEKVAKHHSDIEEFGDLPDTLLNKLSEIFSKRRVLTPHTLPLFLRSDLEEVAINDAANLDEADYRQIFAVCQGLKRLVLRNACQFKDSVIDYMLEKSRGLDNLQLHAANLVSDDKWLQLFPSLGGGLKTLRLSWLDASFNDETVQCIVEHCPNISRLKLKYCRRLTPACLASIAQLRNLEHLSLHLSVSPEPEQLVQLISAVGSNLKTLSFENFVDMDDTVMAAIAIHCSQLQKLRLADMDCVSDAALRALFTTSSTPPFSRSETEKEGDDHARKDEQAAQSAAKTTVVPPLRFLDLSSTRDVDYSNPSGPIDAPIGLADSSFLALMHHSAHSLQTLRIPSCRHVSLDAFLKAFPGDKDSTTTYSNLREINVSFCSNVDTTTAVGFFKCCPAVERVIAFGCFGVEDPVVPRGVALIGVPRAQDAIERVGGYGQGDGTALDESSRFLQSLSAVTPAAA